MERCGMGGWDGEMGGQGDEGTRRQRDKETRGWGEKADFIQSLKPEEKPQT